METLIAILPYIAIIYLTAGTLVMLFFALGGGPSGFTFLQNVAWVVFMILLWPIIVWAIIASSRA